ncbi:beta strand repeat-containing protein [Actinokineospora sp. HUAS TT18]|uniref:beta strand repeat-containing protein n=1 Tax=Actinokineospora sp. HUAS TT18 TaxID=3447451 RepID=UPI003F51C7EA
MQTWAKRGLQTALVTGGLLMLGTGIAAADDVVSPDQPPSALDGSVKIPVKIDNNALGTPFGQKDLPGVNREVAVSPSSLTKALPTPGGATPALPTSGLATPALPTSGLATPALPTTGTLPTPAVPAAGMPTPGLPTSGLPTSGLATPALPTGNVGPVAGPASGPLAPVQGLTSATSALNPASAAAPRHATHDGDPLRGNKIVGDLVIPVDISGNAIALLGNASVENSSEQHVAHTQPIITSGTDSGLAGNVVALNWAAPVQITGNALAVLGNADTYNTASQSAVSGGDIETDGTHGSIAGNVLAGHLATPVQVNGNAGAAGGNATADSASSSEATSGGSIWTSGQDGSIAGNAAALPIGSPVQGNGNSVAVAGISETYSSSDAVAKAGEEVEGIFGSQNYITTNGDPATASGNVVQPALAGPVALTCNAAAGVGNSDAACTSSGDAEAGGGNLTTGEGSTLSGTVAHAPVAIPTQGAGNAAGAIGNAFTDSATAVDSSAGGHSYTKADGSVLSGTVLEPSVGAPIDACGNTGAGGGQAGAVCDNTSNTESGGDAGTTGNDSVGGGNAGTVPVALPGEVLGNTVGAAGSSETTTVENKVTSSGGDNNTVDDAGTLASNLVTVPVSGPAQVTGNGAGAIADTDATTDTASDITAGGYSRAKGDGGSLAGNIVQAPVAVPTQVFSEGATAVGHGNTLGTNDVQSTSGGYAESTGAGGAGAGNIVSAPVGSAVQAYGESVAALGINEAAAESMTESTAGGTAETTGEDGTVSGNVVSAQALPIVQTFGAAATGVGGQGDAAATNNTTGASGGDIATNGDNGFLSGNLLDVPAAAVAQPHGDAVAAVASDSLAASDSATQGTAGGTSTTSGQGGSLNGLDLTAPVGVDAPVYDVPVEVLAEAMTYSTDTRDITVGEDGPQLELPQAGGMEAAALPKLPKLGSLPGRGTARADSANPLGGLLGGLGGLNTVSGLLGGNTLGGGLPIPSQTAPRFAAPAMPGLDNLRGVFSGNLFQAPSLDRLPVQTPALAGLNAPALPADVDGERSLADTQSQLAGAFGHFPIG